MTAIRKTAGICFWLLKVGVIILIMFSVMTFLSEIAHRMRMRLPQPFKGVAVIAMAITTALPFAKAVDGIKDKVLGEAEVLSELEAAAALSELEEAESLEVHV